MNIAFVDLKRQYQGIKEEIDAAISHVIEQSAFIGGPFPKSFEESFAAFCGVRSCVGVGNGTDAIYIALRALGIGPGDEVVTASNSFIATSEAISLTGAKVVFCDINPKTYNIDVKRIEPVLTKRTKAIIPVHLFGQPADMSAIGTIADNHNLRIVEDCAQAHGATYQGKRVGSFGDVSCFSFYPGKNLGAYGDGGAIVTDNDELAERARMIANHGRIDKYNHKMEGVNSRLDGIQAAILQVKLAHLPEWNSQRRRNASLYNDRLRGTRGVVVPDEAAGVVGVYHLYVVRIGDGRRDGLQEHLKLHGVSTGVHYPIALPNLMAYGYLNHSEKDFPEASRASHEILSLPMFPELSETEVDHVAKTIKEFMAS